jgi:hypothetical protein
MSDNKDDTGSPDRDRINLNEDYEVRYWTNHLGITEAQLRFLIRDVGDSVSAVRAALTK